MNLRTLLPAATVVLSACTLATSADSPFAESDSSPSSEETASTGESTPEPDAMSEGDAVSAVCERIDACGFLPAGFRVLDCEDSTRMCLSAGLQSELADWELAVESCLQLQNCFNFLECYESLQTCEVDLDVETTGFGTSTGDAAFEPTTGDEGTTRGQGATGDAGTTGGLLGGESSSTGSGPDDETTGDPSSDSDGERPECGGTCDACLDCAILDPCNVEAVACAENQDCVDVGDCYTTCDDASCYDVCDAIYPGGVVDYIEYAECVLDVCTLSC